MVKIITAKFGGINSASYICSIKANDMNTLQIKIAALSTDTLVEVVKGLNNSFGDAQDLAFELSLAELENRMNETEFIELCSNL